MLRKFLYLRKFWLLIGLVCLISGLLYYVTQTKDITQPHGNYITSVVTRGDVNKVFSSTGETTAENEVLVLCPNNGIVKTVLRAPGSKVLKGEVILTLDKTELQQQYERVYDELKLMQNNLQKLQLSSRTTRVDLEFDIEVKKLRIASLKAEFQDQTDLKEVGGISQVKIDKTKQELVLAEKELTRSKSKHYLTMEQLKTDINGLQLQISMKEKELKTLDNDIRNMVVTSPGTGIILEVRAKKGESKNKNELLARISEHTRVKIKGAVPDKMAEIIKNGGKAFVMLEDSLLEGTVANIKPELENDKVHFDVFLEKPANESIRVNQKVSLFIVEYSKSNVLRIPKGEYTSGKSTQCFVIKNGETTPVKVKTGLEGLLYLEIEKGLKVGDTVVIKKMNT